MMTDENQITPVRAWLNANRNEPNTPNAFMIQELTPEFGLAPALSARYFNARSPGREWYSVGISRQTKRTLAVIFAGFCAFLTVYATQPILPVLRKALGISEFLASLTVTASTLGMAFTAPITGRISDRIGRKKTIVIAGFG